jgi:hypothetical protein
VHPTSHHGPLIDITAMDSSKVTDMYADDRSRRSSSTIIDEEQGLMLDVREKPISIESPEKKKGSNLGFLVWTAINSLATIGIVRFSNPGT